MESKNSFEKRVSEETGCDLSQLRTIKAEDWNGYGNIICCRGGTRVVCTEISGACEPEEWQMVFGDPRFFAVVKR